MYSVGSLVRARGREWVVLPGSENSLLLLRPLGGSDDETTGLLTVLEPVVPASFDLPNAELHGDWRSARLLRDAVRLGFRSSAGPFRSFARIAVEPRPYQLVPLLLALKLNPVRLLIADDVGIGKTVEAGLIARELLDRGEIDRLAVLCPPHLSEQWQRELAEKFHISAELVLPSTATRLERQCRPGESLFERYPCVVVSLDFIKSDSRRAEFLRACPEFVIVDEAHTCAHAGEGRTRHQRHQLLRSLSTDQQRHLLLVTATPHSGNEQAFRSLLSLLDPTFANLPEDLSGPTNEGHRRRIAAHMVQRRRPDIRHYLQADTPFPEREEREEPYTLTPEYKLFFDNVLAYARERMRLAEADGTRKVRRRVQWWSVLALLRSLASSPAAAAATLRTRAASAQAVDEKEADAIGRRTVLDLASEEGSEALDLVPGSNPDFDNAASESPEQARLCELAKEADALCGTAKDAKLKALIVMVKQLRKEGFQPVVFCRFIPTAQYVAKALQAALKGVEVQAVTGELPPSDREDRIAALTEFPNRVLVCTDCLSEGINLQEHFDAVLHYDLSWNPTRHEQREGRVDRYGQPSPKIRVVTFYGRDNQIDGLVLEVLLRKHKAIRSSLGISVPMPVDTDQIIEAIFEGVLLREQSKLPKGKQEDMFADLLKPQREKLHLEWDNATAREKRSRTIFAQESLKPDEVAQELRAVRDAIGSRVEVQSFVEDAIRGLGGTINGPRPLLINLAETPRALRDLLPGDQELRATFELPTREGEIYLTRTHPWVESLATYVMDTALDPISEANAPARRCGVLYTSMVQIRTTLLLVRLRFHLTTGSTQDGRQLLAEDCRLMAFEGAPGSAKWLDSVRAEALLSAVPSANVPPDRARYFLDAVLSELDPIHAHLEEQAHARARELFEAHRRVRAAARARSAPVRAEPQLPPDILGLYIYLPTPSQ